MVTDTSGSAAKNHIRVALTGNPNAGKTTIFNHFTGFHQRVGNYPGVTVEKKEGDTIHNGRRLTLVDLPGVYSLTPYTLEEVVTRRVLLEERPDVVVDVLDSTNIERNLYLAVQLKELGVPIVLALNMSDEARANGIVFDLKKLSGLLGMPIVPTVGHKRKGLSELLDAVVAVAESGEGNQPRRITYGRDIDEAVQALRELVESEGVMTGVAGPGWVAVKLLEGDEEVTGQIKNEKVLAEARRQAERLEKLLGEQTATVMADRRYGFISGACQEAVRTTVESRHTTSDRIDEVVMNEALGIPILLAMMYGVFYFTFTLGDPLIGGIEWVIAQLGTLITAFWPADTMGLLRSLVVNGIIGGVGGVIVFLPNIMLLFLAIAMLEDTGYMARAAFTMDRLMHRIGLHGKSFIPLLIGFGCTIPAIMATRILDSRRERLVTMLIAPLMSCGARLAIYALMIPAFFPRSWQAPVLWIIYVTGILLAIGCAKLLSKTMFRGESDPFVMELPPYRMPTVKSVVIHMWERAKQYLRKAGTIILAVSIVLWALSTFPRLEHFSGAGEGLAAGAYRQYAAGVSEVAEQIGLSSEGASILADSLGVEGVQPDDLATVSRYDSVWIGRFMSALCEADASPDGTIDLTRWRQRVRQAGILADAIDLFHNKIRPEYKQMLERARMTEHQEQLEYSAAGRMGHALEVVLRPLGLDWKVATALVGAFAAKEVFVAQMGIIYAVEDGAGGGAESLRTRLHSQYNTLQAVCILLFVLIGTPCMATLAVTRKESGSWRWAALQWSALTGMAYVITLAVYQLGLLAGLGG